MNYTDEQLKLALVKMLPDKVEIVTPDNPCWFCWKHPSGSEIRDTELLHLCWLVEQGLHHVKQGEFSTTIAQRDEQTFVWDFDVVHASWQQRTVALAKTKGIEII